MISLTIPGSHELQLKFLVLDFNGTLAVDGELLPGVAERLVVLSSLIEIHVVTADTFGTARKVLEDLPLKLTILATDDQAKAKRYHVLRLGAEYVAAVGNGHNDERMVSTAALGIAVMQGEGASPVTLASAKIATTSILNALDLIINPKRLVATLRA